jgi:RNA polymerase sigma factor (sigma-70 family)
LFKHNPIIQPLQQLIAGCLNGDRKAQEVLYALLAPSMLVVCLRYSVQKEDAEECLQEGFLQVFRCIAQYRNEGSFEGWVRKIMVNSSLKKIRSKPILYSIPHTDVEDIEVLVEEDSTQKLHAKELIEMVQTLPPSYRVVFNLFVFEQMTHREIADTLNISEGTSKSNLFEARKILQKKLRSQIHTNLKLVTVNE